MDINMQGPICWNMLFCRFHERGICKFKHPVDLPLNKIKHYILEEIASTTSVYEFRINKLNDALDYLNVDEGRSTNSSGHTEVEHIVQVHGMESCVGGTTIPTINGSESISVGTGDLNSPQEDTLTTETSGLMNKRKKKRPKNVLDEKKGADTNKNQTNHAKVSTGEIGKLRTKSTPSDKNEEESYDDDENEWKFGKTRKKQRMKRNTDSVVLDENQLSVMKQAIDIALSPFKDSVTILERKYEILSNLVKETRN